MPPIHDTYGTDRARVMRVAHGEWDDMREASTRIVLEGAFSAASTHADNAATAAVTTRIIKTLADIVVRANLEAGSYGPALARRLLDLRLRVHARIERAAVTPHETRWPRPAPCGEPHPHAVLLDGGAKAYARPVVDRRREAVETGARGFVAPFGMDADTQMFVPTDEPHERIACRSGRA